MAVERRGAAIDIVGLGKEYVSGQGRVVALDDINLRIAPGQQMSPSSASSRQRNTSPVRTQSGRR